MPGVPLVMDGFSAPAAVTVYWRPGCPFCMALRRRLRRTGLPTHEVDIWQDPEGAAAVRRVTGGDETVPTVLVGDTALVNPLAATVIEAARRAGVVAAVPRSPAARSVGTTAAVVQWVVIAALVVASFALDGSGHGALSWAADGVAIVTYLAFRALRRRLGGAGTAT